MNLSDSPIEKKFINDLITIKIPVSVYLKNNIRLRGHLIANNSESVFLKAGEIQKIYKNRISTIEPSVVFCNLFKQ